MKIGKLLVGSSAGEQVSYLSISLLAAKLKVKVSLLGREEWNGN